MGKGLYAMNALVMVARSYAFQSHDRINIYDIKQQQKTAKSQM